jgi:cytochrome c biogenesis protein CcdA
MGDAHIATAFTLGMLATVNPCALPMLPAYLGWFIVGDAEQHSPSARVSRAVGVAGCVTVGFVAVFGLLATLTSAGTSKVMEITPWMTPIVGLALAAVGVTLLVGKTVRLPTPRIGGTGGRRGLAAMLLYGVSYAVVSVTCALGLFLAYVSTNAGANWTTSLTHLVAFTSGFGLVLVALSVSVAVLGGSLVAGMRRAAAYANRIAGGLLVVSGLYLAWYGAAEIRLEDGPREDPIINRVTGWSASINQRVESIGGVEVGLVLALFLCVVTMAVLLHNPGRSRAPQPRRRRPPAQTTRTAQRARTPDHAVK